MLKKSLFLLAVILSVLPMSVAQTESVGLRLGGGQVVRGEVVGRLTLDGWNMPGCRLEGSIGWLKEGHHIDQTFSAVWQWTGAVGHDLGFYAGVGTSFSWRQWGSGYGEPQFVPAVCAQAGLEYRIPETSFSLSLDICPWFEIPDATLSLGNVALGLHYSF